MIVVDSSAVIAMMLGEPDSEALRKRLSEEPVGERVLSVANYVEAATVLAGRQRFDPAQGVVDLDNFLSLVGIDLAVVDHGQARLACQARIRFGRGFSAKAKLNFGDSFAYALAKSLDASLLFIGDDFAATDVKPAL